MTAPVKHWRECSARMMTRSGWTLCKLREESTPRPEFTCRPNRITCPECKRLKGIRAAAARIRLAKELGL